MSKTIIEVKHAVLVYFTQENTIDPDKHHELVKFECADIDLKKALIKEVLRQLATVDIVREVPVEVNTYTKNIWVLTKPLGTYEKSLSISFETALAVSESLNKYFKAVGNTSQYTDMTDIKEHDLQKLALIVESATPVVKNSS